MRRLLRSSASISAALILILVSLSGCGAYVDCSQVTQERINGRNDAQIAASLGITEQELDTRCY